MAVTLIRLHRAPQRTTVLSCIHLIFQQSVNFACPSYTPFPQLSQVIEMCSSSVTTFKFEPNRFIDIETEIHDCGRNITVAGQALLVYEINKMHPLIYSLVFRVEAINILHTFTAAKCGLINTVPQAT